MLYRFFLGVMLGFSFACTAELESTPDPQTSTSVSPSHTPIPIQSDSASEMRDISDLAGCWKDITNPASQRFQYYSVTGEDTLDLKLVVGGMTRQSKVRLKPDGFLEIIGEPTLGETLEWRGDQLIFKIGGSQSAIFERC